MTQILHDNANCPVRPGCCSNCRPGSPGPWGLSGKGWDRQLEEIRQALNSNTLTKERT